MASTHCQRCMNSLAPSNVDVYHGSSLASANSVARFGTTKLKMNSSASTHTESTTSG